MNPRSLAAIAACSRTLADGVDADPPVERSGETTLGPLRAHGDRAALRRRFAHPLVDLRHRPGDPNAAGLYDALGDARLDAIGVAWLPGVAANLLAFPGADDDGLRWLAFECFSGMAAPAEKARLVTRTRGALAAGLLDGLTALGVSLRDQEAFAAAAVAWCVRAADGVAPTVRQTAGRGFRIPGRHAGADPRRGRYAAPGQEQRAGAPPRTGDDEHHGASPAKASRDPIEAIPGYRVYTKAFDRITNAVSLTSRDDLARLRLELDGDFGPLRSTVAKLSKRLLRVLMARQVREWQFDLDEGLLDPSRLPVYVASGGAARPFKRELESPFPSTAVTLLLDHSGSMRGRPMKIAALTVEIFARVLERCGVACEVLGFTTREWDGGEPGRRWAAAGYPEAPGRLNALEHIVIKSFTTPWRRARAALGLALHDEVLKENVDGEALAWAYQRLASRAERRRILVVVSDGAPMDEATSAANGFDYLDAHLAATVAAIERQRKVSLAAIGIGHNVSQFYANATRISKVDDLGPALATRLIAILDEPE